MTSILMWTVLVGLSMYVIGVRANTDDLFIYRLRVKMLYDRMKAEGCTLPGHESIGKRAVLQGTSAEELEIEKVVFKKLTASLTACRKANGINSGKIFFLYFYITLKHPQKSRSQAFYIV